MQFNVLHIIPHLGGGAGKVLRGLFDAINTESTVVRQSICCLEGANEFSKKWAALNSYELMDNVVPDSSDFHTQVSEADIVHVHFWNHPLLYHFLWAFSGKKARMVFWSYTNGVYPPSYIPKDILDYGNRFVVSTPYSWKSPIFSKINPELDRKVSCIFMTAGTKGFDVEYQPLDDRFHIGYVGTVDYCKLYKDFIALASQIQIPNYRFSICGGPSHHSLEKEIENSPLRRHFEVLGPQDDIASFLKTLDVFVYPLERENYGTGEQVLIEAMVAGVPQVVFANGPEEYVVKHGITGLVADGEKAFIEAIHSLWSAPDYRSKLSAQSRKYAREEYSMGVLLDSWMCLYRELLKADKVDCTLKLPESSISWQAQLFLFALGDDTHAYALYKAFFEEDFTNNNALRQEIKKLPPIFHSKTKGSCEHYKRFLPCAEFGLQ